MTHEGEPVKANQFYFKALLLDIMMMMGAGVANSQNAVMIEMKLSQVF